MKRIPFIRGGLILYMAFLLVIPAMGAQTTSLSTPPPEADAPAPDTPAPMTDIHDILPPVSVGIHAPWLVPVLLTLGAAAILAAAWWFWQKRKKTSAIGTIVPELPPEMTAMRALNEISDVQRLDSKTFYFHMSAILRQYVFGRFSVGAPEMTSEEFMPCIDRMHMESDLAQRLKGLCRAMDPVKFGGETVVEKQMEADLLFAREFVRKTTPMPDIEDHTTGREPSEALPQTAP